MPIGADFVRETGWIRRISEYCARCNGGDASPAKDLAEEVALSPSACHRREAEGIIRGGYVALLDARRAGRRATVFVEITLVGQADDVLEAFEQAVALIPDMLECHLMAGSADYLLMVSAGDSDDFARIHRAHLSRLPHVAQMHSSFALRTMVKTTARPLG